MAIDPEYITIGSRFVWQPDGSVWECVDGPYSIYSDKLCWRILCVHCPRDGSLVGSYTTTFSMARSEWAYDDSDDDFAAFVRGVRRVAGVMEVS